MTIVCEFPPVPAPHTYSMLLSWKLRIQELTVGVMGAAPLPSMNPRPDATYLTLLSAVHSGAPLMPSPASYRKRRSPPAAVQTSSDMLNVSNHMLPSGLSTAGIYADADERKGSVQLGRSGISVALPFERHGRAARSVDRCLPVRSSQATAEGSGVRDCAALFETARTTHSSIQPC